MHIAHCYNGFMILFWIHIRIQTQIGIQIRLVVDPDFDHIPPSIKKKPGSICQGKLVPDVRGIFNLDVQTGSRSFSKYNFGSATLLLSDYVFSLVAVIMSIKHTSSFLSYPHHGNYIGRYYEYVFSKGVHSIWLKRSFTSRAFIVI